MVARGAIERDVTVNLVALRRLDGDENNTQALRQYILGLSLVAATAPLDLFLRQGCLLIPDTETAPQWELVRRDGIRREVEMTEYLAKSYASAAAEAFGVETGKTVSFDKNLAKEDIKKKDGK